MQRSNLESTVIIQGKLLDIMTTGIVSYFDKDMLVVYWVCKNIILSVWCFFIVRMLSILLHLHRTLFR